MCYNGVYSQERPIMSTNTDKPFEPGEVIIWNEEEYIVLANHGTSGRVKYNIPDNTEEIGSFWWSCFGCTSVRKEA